MVSPQPLGATGLRSTGAGREPPLQLLAIYLEPTQAKACGYPY